MTVDEIFTSLCTHMKEGIAIHCEISNAYDFLGLYGFKECHDYHYLSESKNYRCLSHYYSTHYHKLIRTENISQPRIIPDNWYNYTTMAVDAGTKKTAVKDLMRQWIEWEQNTKTLYQNSYKMLLDLGEVAAAQKLLYFLYDVDSELKHAIKKQIKLETLNYDIDTIIKWQQHMYKKYKAKIK